jgi:hypothetical protein
MTDSKADIIRRMFAAYRDGTFEKQASWRAA